MLPSGSDGSGRYGFYEMELLINKMMKRGAKHYALEAKVPPELLGEQETSAVEVALPLDSGRSVGLFEDSDH